MRFSAAPTLEERGKHGDRSKTHQEDRVGSQGACFSLGGEKQGLAKSSVASNALPARRWFRRLCGGRGFWSARYPAALQGVAADHREGHHAVYPPAGDDDESRRAAAPDFRDRRSGARQSGCRQAAAGYQVGCRNRQFAFASLPEVSPAIRYLVLQPGGCRRTGGYSRNLA
jgi:hypothetical protein